MPSPVVAVFARDQLALGVAGVELLAGLVAPERLGDLVDEILRLLGVVTHCALTEIVCVSATSL